MTKFRKFVPPNLTMAKWLTSVYRVACLPSIPMASVIFSILSIIKSMFDLNVYPLLTTQVSS